MRVRYARNRRPPSPFPKKKKKQKLSSISNNAGRHQDDDGGVLGMMHARECVNERSMRAVNASLIH